MARGNVRDGKPLVSVGQIETVDHSVGYVPTNDASTGATTNVTSNGAYGDLAQSYVGDLYKGYQSQYSQLQNTLNNANSSTNTTYNSSANNAYQAYMQAKKSQKDMASNYGMTGGAVEGLKVRNVGNYNTNMANNESGRNQSLQNNQNTFDINAASALQSYNNSVSQAQYEAQQNDLERKDAQAAANYNAWVSSIGRYTTKKACDKAIKALDKNDPYFSQKKMQLQAQKATCKR